MLKNEQIFILKKEDTTMTEKSILYRQINTLCAQRGVSLAYVAKELKITPQNLYIRLNRGKMTYEEISAIAGILGYDFRYDFQPKQSQNFVQAPAFAYENE